MAEKRSERPESSVGVATIDGGRITGKPKAAKGKAVAKDTASVKAGSNRVPHSKPIDAATGFEISEEFALFDQRNDVFSRANWDETVRTEQAIEFWTAYIMPNARARKADGYSQRDYALRNAAWHFTKAFATLKSGDEGRHEGFNDTFTLHGPGWPEKWALDSPGESAAEIKKVAALFGADLVGVCEYDERWVYSMKFNRMDQSSRPPDVDARMTHVIVVVTAMDHDLTATVPSALAATATGMGYTKDAVTLMSLAQYIRNLGYEAHASMNDTGLNIPLAVQAGLGEYGRHGLLITKEYGPRVRIGKIFTDMPLEPDPPAYFGVTKFCQICEACAAGCPPKAIPFDAPKREAPNGSSFATIRKWTTDAEKCFKFWTSQNTECSICIRVCPYNRMFKSRFDWFWRWLAGTRLRKLALWLDRYRDGSRQQAKSWWRRS
jgi:epoxyqueuosine reductase QueG